MEQQESGPAPARGTVVEVRDGLVVVLLDDGTRREAASAGHLRWRAGQRVELSAGGVRLVGTPVVVHDHR